MSETSQEIWAFSEDQAIFYELLAGVRSLGSKVCAVQIGNKPAEETKDLISMGADKVYVIEAPQLLEFQPEPYSEALVTLARRERPEAILLGATRRGRELAPRVAAAMGIGCVADCTGLLRDTAGTLAMERVAYAGKGLATLKSTSQPFVCTVKPRVFEPLSSDSTRVGEIQREVVEVKPSRVTLVRREQKPKGKVNLPEAKIVVSGGRGFKKKEDLVLLQESADILGGEVGCSRPLSSDLGWLPEEHHIGISGISIKPQLYIAVGISGQLHHLVGIRDSRIVAAINTDKDAPIMAASDYALVGDLYTLLPELTKAFRELLKQK